MGRWIKDGNLMKYYDDSGNLVKTFDTNINTMWQSRNGDGKEHAFNDQYKVNDEFTRGTVKQLEKAIQYFLEHGTMPDESTIGIKGKGYENVLKDVRQYLKDNQIDEVKYSLNQNEFIYSDKGGELNTSYVTPEMIEKMKLGTSEEVAPILNPYTDYMEQKRIQQQGNEKGLLDAQTTAAKQNADILAQQTMQQQGMFRDELIEQIKSDRLAKMRAGISPMQIAQENLQYTVGNMQANNQQVALANQQQLAATQQQAMNPYQAYINSVQGVTGGQGYGQVATGFAATDAGDLNMQALRYLQNNKGATYEQAMAAVKGN